MQTITPIPAFEDNYFWALQHDSTACIVVDPGDAAPVLAFLTQNQLRLSAIWTTHRHPDHVGGVLDLLAAFPVPVLGPVNETIPARTQALQQGDSVMAGANAFTVWDVPGHTNGHIAYVGQGVAFVGDTLFAGGCGRVFDGTAAQLHDSLSRLSGLPPDTLVFCAHEYTLSNLRFAQAVEPHNVALFERVGAEQAKRNQGIPTVPSTIAIENATNPFLRCHMPDVQAAASEWKGQTLTEPVAVFTALREWKNVFR
jgi:hydroxyacylglutathione hydrolase